MDRKGVIPQRQGLDRWGTAQGRVGPVSDWPATGPRWPRTAHPAGVNARRRRLLPPRGRPWRTGSAWCECQRVPSPSAPFGRQVGRSQVGRACVARLMRSERFQRVLPRFHPHVLRAGARVGVRTCFHPQARSVRARMWTGGRPLAVLTRTAPARATSAHISIIGHITQTELRRLPPPSSSRTDS